MPKLHSVLPVDDDPTANFLHEMLFRRLALAEQVLVAENGQAALALLYQASTAPVPRYPDLILLDLQMPILNGFDFLRAYQPLPAAPQPTCIVVLTTSSNAQDLARLATLPIAGVMTKPLTPEKLATIFQRCLQRPLPGQ